MKVALFAIGRMENRYAVEWVEHYKNIGFDKIFIYDNNFGDEEHFEDVLQPYIDSRFVEITDYRDRNLVRRKHMLIVIKNIIKISIGLHSSILMNS